MHGRHDAAMIGWPAPTLPVSHVLVIARPLLWFETDICIPQKQIQIGTPMPDKGTKNTEC